MKLTVAGAVLTTALLFASCAASAPAPSESSSSSTAPEAAESALTAWTDELDPSTLPAAEPVDDWSAEQVAAVRDVLVRWDVAADSDLAVRTAGSIQEANTLVQADVGDAEAAWVEATFAESPVSVAWVFHPGVEVDVPKLTWSFQFATVDVGGAPALQGIVTSRGQYPVTLDGVEHVIATLRTYTVAAADPVALAAGDLSSPYSYDMQVFSANSAMCDNLLVPSGTLLPADYVSALSALIVDPAPGTLTTWDEVLEGAPSLESFDQAAFDAANAELCASLPSS